VTLSLANLTVSHGVSEFGGAVRNGGTGSSAAASSLAVKFWLR
jgi:hypothetical protein